MWGQTPESCDLGEVTCLFESCLGHGNNLEPQEATRGQKEIKHVTLLWELSSPM